MKCMDKHEFEQQNVFGTGAANTAYAKFFIGQSFLNPLTDPKTGLFLANVTFEPGCRDNWHIHHAAKADSWFSHIAVEVPGKDCSNEWCEPVTDEEYAKLNG